MKSLNLPEKITLCEVGLRDGLQNESSSLTTEQKLELLKDIAASGFTVIEVGSFVSPRAVPQMADTDKLYESLTPDGRIEYRALVANLKGVERAAACGCKKIKLNVSASRAHNLANLNCLPEETVNGFIPCVELARQNGLSVSGSISMPFGSPWEKEIPLEDVQKIVRAYIKAGIREISLSDASGMASPASVYSMCLNMRQEFEEVTWWLHFHNTRGLGIANIMAGMQAGFTRFDTSFAGTGGCPFVPGAAGNVSTEDVLYFCEEMGIETGIDLGRAMAVGKKAAGLLGRAADSYLLKAGRAGDLNLELPVRQIKNHTLTAQK